MHYINIIDSARPDDFFMFMSARVNPYNIQRNNNWTLCKINDNELTVNLLALYLSEYIWENTLPKFCLDLLGKYKKIPHNIKKDIATEAMNVASCMKSYSSDIVAQKLSEYLRNEYCFLSVDGFVLFRLKGLIDDIRTLVNITIYENNIEEEYNEFIRFMKELVSEQQPVYDEIFLFESKEGFKIVTAAGIDITNSYGSNMRRNSKQIKNVNQNNENNYFDSIISTVISIAPKKNIYALFR